MFWNLIALVITHKMIMAKLHKLQLSETTSISYKTRATVLKLSFFYDANFNKHILIQEKFYQGLCWKDIKNLGEKNPNLQTL